MVMKEHLIQDLNVNSLTFMMSPILYVHGLIPVIPSR